VSEYHAGVSEYQAGVSKYQAGVSKYQAVVNNLAQFMSFIQSLNYLGLRIPSLTDTIEDKTMLSLGSQLL
jgi:X-X-X-Leu-X-X-Gly heptad repeat protein